MEFRARECLLDGENLKFNFLKGKKMLKEKIKKIISIGLMCSMVCSPLVVFANENVSNDVTGHWAKDTISKWQKNGWISGYEDGNFRPQNQIKRSEIVKLVNKKFNFTAGSLNPNFTDVKDSDWFHAEVKIAVNKGYIKGFEDNTFRPDAAVTRAQMAVILAKLVKARAGAQKTFTDENAIPAWAKEAVKTVVQAGFMQGYPDGSFKAENFMSRAEVVVALDRISSKDLVDSEKETAPKDKLPNDKAQKPGTSGSSGGHSQGTTPASAVLERSISATPVVAGQKLENSKLSGTFVDARDNEVSGAFRWENSDEIVNEEGKHNYVFDPNDSEKFMQHKGSVTVKIISLSAKEPYKVSQPQEVGKYGSVEPIPQTFTVSDLKNILIVSTNSEIKITTKEEAEGIVNADNFNASSQKQDSATVEKGFVIVVKNQAGGISKYEIKFKPAEDSVKLSYVGAQDSEAYKVVGIGSSEFGYLCNVTNDTKAEIVNSKIKAEGTIAIIAADKINTVTDASSFDSVSKKTGEASVTERDFVVVLSKDRTKLGKYEIITKKSDGLTTDKAKVSASPITKGQQLKKSQLICEGNFKDGIGMNNVSGELVWVDPDMEVSETGEYEYMFIPEGDFNPAYGKVKVTVQ